ncbi:hypothetical protein GCM10011390_28770 [Aureimonas endophytica]|uniref:Holliday junction resolvase RusA-like endonuclease n=1 Tax=Aureimonas endophytica TaxID=2027858 RepID=A0A916ZPP6_9HYPH|nr:RusA family crossover junction endodeoxyribonuclease [Aureimonas endophytica]GGE07968.1 hypothetical protein GCM10011390_28770 [Aureimonas endophytica]
MRGPKRRNETLVPLPPLLDFSVAGPAVSFRARRKPLLHAWRDKVRAAAMAAHGGELLSGGLTVWITEFSQVATKDRDNLAKPMLDAMQGVIYADDRQVLELHVDWSDIDGSYIVRHMSPVVAAALSRGDEFLWLRVARHVPRTDLLS